MHVFIHIVNYIPLICVFSSSSVLYVGSFSELSIFDCPFGILYRLFIEFYSGNSFSLNLLFVSDVILFALDLLLIVDIYRYLHCKICLPFIAYQPICSKRNLQLNSKIHLSRQSSKVDIIFIKRWYRHSMYVCTNYLSRETTKFKLKGIRQEMKLSF